MFIPYKLADGSTALVEVTEEVAAFLERSDREISNADRRERYHAPYHREALEYEGTEYAAEDNPEQLWIEKENAAHTHNILSQLTDTQLRRLTMKADGMTVREIAAAEGISPNAVMDSLRSIRRIFQKNL